MPNNEFYTPEYVVEHITEYVPKDAVIWCPFDTKDSHFVKVLSRTNKVLYSHIADGCDYYETNPDGWDIMISNPPFQGKKQIFERALEFGKPFALLMTLQWLNDAAPHRIWPSAGKDLELLTFDKRIHYLNGITGDVEKKTTFSSAFYCSDFLPKQIVMKELM